MIREFTYWTDYKSVNWVDDENRLVGYDFEVRCCENFGYFFSKARTPEEAIEKGGKEEHDEFPGTEMKNARFAKKNPEVFDHHAVFEIENSEWKYLVLYNFHSGFYSHGFFVGQNGEKIFSDEI